MEGAPQFPVVLHVPHASRTIPPELRRDFALDDTALVREHDESADTATDLIAAAARLQLSHDAQPWSFVNGLSRLVVDPERFPDESEPMNRRGRGAVYHRSCADTPLRTPSATPDDILIDTYFRPYAQAMADLVTDRIRATGRAIVLDIHSYPMQPSWFEDAGQARPAICLGVDEHHTPTWLHRAAQESFSSFGEVADNSPYAGCYVPLDRYRSDTSVSALMIEIRRDLYLDENVAPVPDRAAALGGALAELIERIAAH
ncbi:N-formylglutamate amidohydrolase [Gordonia phthalatica]|uniref:N-formylglutamate amidohydrolase n=1 Tax=Gordonia phthalatica TaxID=1136941 RepID=A0A0N9MVW4_9ACTN|nr:N-formylglutamate amidohydrolase [Gordonia phthalatica]